MILAPEILLCIAAAGSVHDGLEVFFPYVVAVEGGVPDERRISEF